MSKEQLETAKLMARMLRLETRLPYDFPFDLVDWLVEQAERAQELESDSYNAHLERLLDRKEQEIERYREALEFYADRENYEPEHYDFGSHDYTSMIDRDKGATARKALDGEE